MAEIADVLAAYGLRIEPGAPGTLDARVIELVERCETLRARLERAERAQKAVHAHLRSGHLQCAYTGISPRLCSCGDCGALAAALGAAGEEQKP